MPAMIRPKGMPKKIAYKLLGVPYNMQNRNDKKNEKVRRRIMFEETSKVR